MKTIILTTVIALCANSAHAGLFSRLFGCRGGSGGVAKPAVKAKAPQYRYECKNGVCRRVEVK